MSIDLAGHIARLSDERAKLETFLGRHAGWSAWHTAVAEGAGGAPHAARLRAGAEVDLAGNPVFPARHALSAAIETLETLQSLGAIVPNSEVVDEGDVADREFAAAPVERVVDVTATRAANELHVATTKPEAQDDRTPPPESLVPESQVPESLAPALPCSVASLPSALHDAGHLPHAPSRCQHAAIIHPGPPDIGRSADSMWWAQRPPDDLTRIRRIDRTTAEALTARGIRFFDQIAAFSHADVRTLAAALNLGRRISQENWIEQSAVLASRAATERARRLAEARTSPLRGVPSSGAEPNLPKGAEPPPPVPGQTPPPAREPIAIAAEHDTAIASPLVAPATPDASTVSHQPARAVIERLPDTIALALNIREAARRIANNATAAEGTSSEPETPVIAPPPLASERPGVPTPTVAHQGPAEEQDLAEVTSGPAGSAPEHASPQRPEPLPLVIETAVETEPEPIISEGVAETATAPVTSPPPVQDFSLAGAHSVALAAAETVPLPPAENSARSDTVTPPGAEPDTPPEPPAVADDLEMISGIDATTASDLAALGITSFSEIAAWGPGEVQRVTLALGGVRRIGRDNWIEQAAVLARGLETAYALRRQLGDCGSLVAPPVSAPAPDASFAHWLACQTSALPLAPRTAPLADVDGQGGEAASEPPRETLTPEPLDGAPAAMPSAESHAPVAPGGASIDGPGGRARLDDASAGQAEPGPDAGPLHEEPHPGETGHRPAPLAAASAENVPPAAPDLQAERGHRPQPIQPPPLPQSHTLDAPGSITARIKALERDLAALEIRPLSPTQPRRVVLPRPAELTTPAEPTAAPPLPDERWQHDALRRVLGPEDDAIPETEPHAAAMPEADVTIIRQAAREIGLEPLPESTTLRSAEESAGDEFDADDYAGYHGRIEEASVEIVRPAEGNRPPLPADTPSEKGAGAVGGRPEPRPGETVSRFLKALKGS